MFLKKVLENFFGQRFGSWPKKSSKTFLSTSKSFKIFFNFELYVQ